MIGISTILSKLTGLVKWVTDPKNLKTVLFIVIALLGVFIFKQCNTIENLEYDNQISKSNIAALSSELETTRDSLGNVTSERGALQGSVDELRNLNSSLAETVDSLRQNPTIITRTVTRIERDTVFNVDTEADYLGDATFRFEWQTEESGNWGFREIAGRNTFTLVNDTTVSNVNTDIVRDVMEMTITTGFRETEEGFLRVFATTQFPGVQQLDVQGALIDPRKYVETSNDRKRWGLGFQLGYGFNQEFKANPYIGIGVSYNPITW